jgi:PTH2 family peptidyl-tRNA hydrolase
MKIISKQIIVMRKSFVINGKKVTPRKGKYIAQGAHASLKAILDLMKEEKYEDGTYEMSLSIHNPVAKQEEAANGALRDWLKGQFTKICVSVETEEELLEVYNKAKAKGLICSLITDAGNTEFDGIPTITCCAIGPAWSDDLEDITKHLQLF